MSDFAVNVSSGWRNINFHFFDAASHKIPGIHLSFWLVIVLAGGIAAIAGVVIGAPTLRLKSDYLALVTLGFGEILPEVFRNSDNLPTGPQPDQRHQGHRSGRPGRHGFPQLHPRHTENHRFQRLPNQVLRHIGVLRAVRVGLGEATRRPSRPGLDGNS
jgi:hypothetical protein